VCCNHPFSDAIFLTVLFVPFSACGNIYIVQWFVHLLAFFFAFLVCMLICLLTLFFAIVLFIGSLSFCDKLLIFTPFIVLQISAGVTSTFLMVLLPLHLLFRCFRGVCALILWVSFSFGVC